MPGFDDAEILLGRAYLKFPNRKIKPEYAVFDGWIFYACRSPEHGVSGRIFLRRFQRHFCQS